MKTTYLNTIPKSILEQIKTPKPDIDAFKRLITTQQKPQKVHLCELFADQEIMQWFTENVFEKQWVPISEDIETQKKHLLCEIDYWHKIGYDYIRVTGGLNLKQIATNIIVNDERNWVDMNKGLITCEEDFEKISHIELKDEDLWMYEFVADNLPDGMGILACPASGFLEIPMEYLVGYEAMAMLSFDKSDLLEKVFAKVRELINGVYSKVVGIERIAGFFQGDDMGYKTSTMFSPEFLKKYSLPGHKQAAEIAHSCDKIYLLHSCGYLFEIMDYLIDEVKIDAKQSYEDVIMPVEEFYGQYSSRIAVLGGLDVNLLASASPEQVRKRTRAILEKCFDSGRYAMGSGNTITNYCKIENVLAMLDEAFTFLK